MLLKNFFMTSALVLIGAVPMVSAASLELSPITDSYNEFIELAERKPTELASAVESLTPYIVEAEDGTVQLLASEDIIQQLDPDAYAVLAMSISLQNALQLDSLETPRSIPGAIIKFVTKNWSKIKKAAEKSGKWAWYKSANCAAGAQQALWKSYGADVAHMASEPTVAVAIASAGCIANL